MSKYNKLLIFTHIKYLIKLHHSAFFDDFVAGSDSISESYNKKKQFHSKIILLMEHKDDRKINFYLFVYLFYLCLVSIELKKSKNQEKIYQKYELPNPIKTNVKFVNLELLRAIARGILAINNN
ncbi:hypothetical protein BpHYR1_015671 [Brachionus plicatilis]|uniref:Uncharacterized protein n=1 Tax=Brachionus plicatilis TaxID=10195 RepID=A0A3M7RBL2_BRAPC|nr:hypothetical protein BpHYR1_015671 [Brachionus plicatilis]